MRELEIDCISSQQIDEDFAKPKKIRSDSGMGTKLGSVHFVPPVLSEISRTINIFGSPIGAEIIKQGRDLICSEPIPRRTK